MLSLLVYFHLILDIAISHRYIRVSCLLLSNNYTLSIGQVSNAGIFQTVELILLRKAYGITHLAPTLLATDYKPLSFTRFQTLSENVAMARMLEDLQFYHQLQDFIIKGNHSVLAVLTDGRTDKDSLILDRYISDLYLGQTHSDG